MKAFNKKQLLEAWPELIMPLLHAIAANEEDMALARDALFNRPLIGAPGQTHVHMQGGFATIKGVHLHYAVEFVITSLEKQTVGVTLSSVVLYENDQEFEEAKIKGGI